MTDGIGGTQRYRALDGVRGVAAIVVMISHVMLTSNSFARITYGDLNAVPPGTWEWFLAYTPLHVLWAGTEAVYVFFVLSGVVLTLNVVRRPATFSWTSYYPKRLLRLYLPVWAAVIFGFALARLVPRVPDVAGNPWLNSRPNVTTGGLFHDLTLLLGPSRVISPLWSLQWEILFSLLLPIYVLFALRLPRLWPIKIGFIFALMATGLTQDVGSLLYLPMFALGGLMAASLPRLIAAGRLIPDWAWRLVAGGALVLLTAPWMLAGVGDDVQARALSPLIGVLGAACIVFVATSWPPAARCLESPIVAWLGAVSFSLYLVHEPLVLAFTFAFGPAASWIAVPVAIVLAWLFERYIEKPSHRFAAAVGSRVDRRRRRPAATYVAPSEA